MSIQISTIENLLGVDAPAVFQTAQHPGWDAKNETLCETFGEAWYHERRSALLLVPSMPARLERIS